MGWLHHTPYSVTCTIWVWNRDIKLRLWDRRQHQHSTHGTLITLNTFISAFRQASRMSSAAIRTSQIKRTCLLITWCVICWLFNTAFHTFERKLYLRMTFNMPISVVRQSPSYNGQINTHFIVGTTGPFPWVKAAGAWTRGYECVKLHVYSTRAFITRCLITNGGNFYLLSLQCSINSTSWNKWCHCRSYLYNMCRPCCYWRS